MEELNLIPKYSEIRALEATDTDFRNKWKVSSVIKHMLAVAGVHSNMSGWGWNDLKDSYNVCLVLVQTHLEMIKYPSCYTRVKVSTWPDNEKHAIITRYFSFENADTGEQYGKAAIQCVLMDMTARSVVWANRYDLPRIDTSHLEVACKVPKLKIPRAKIGDSANCLKTHETVYTDLDYNGHVNNAKYVEWVENLFSTEQYTKADISSFDIKYHKEMKFGEEAVMEMIDDCKESSRYFVRGTVNKDNENHCCFEASVEFAV